MSWSSFQTTNISELLWAGGVCVYYTSRFVLSFPREPRRLTLFILVGASGAVAVARLQSVVSPGPAERGERYI